MPLILVVEDEPILRSTVVRALSRMPGVEVIDAGTVSDALALAFAQRPEMIISDIDLPDGSGIEMLSVLAARGTRVPTVLVTAFLREFGSRVPIDPGVTVLEKPVPLDTLRELVREHLGTVDVTPLDSAFSVSDYVQLAAISNRSLTLVITVGGARAGTIHFKAGEAWAAEDRQGEGEAAFERLVALEHAECMPGHAADAPIARNLYDSAVSMLLRSWTGTGEARKAPQHTPAELDSLRQTDSHAVVPSAEHTEADAETAKARASAVHVPSETNAASSSTEDNDSPLFGDSSPRTRFDELKDEGLEALLMRDYDSAVTALEAAAALCPDDQLVRANLMRLATLRAQSGA